jgi:hypothetical protein
MNWKGFRRERSWSKKATVSGFVWRRWRNPQKSSIRVRSEQLPNASSHSYRCINLLGATDDTSIPAAGRTVAETAQEQELLSVYSSPLNWLRAMYHNNRRLCNRSHTERYSWSWHWHGRKRLPEPFSASDSCCDVPSIRFTCDNNNRDLR